MRDLHEEIKDKPFTITKKIPRKSLAKQLKKESELVREESMQILKEFESIND